MHSDTTIIIPTLNEQENIGPLISRLHELYPGIAVIISDDGSTDHTRDIAGKSGAFVVDRHLNDVKGITAAVVDALQYVKTPFIIVMDADFQHPPGKVKEIIRLLKTHDLVIAARRTVIGHWGFFRRAQSSFATILACVRLMKHVHDPLSGFFGVRTELFMGIDKRNFEMQCFKILFNILKNIDFRTTRLGYVFYDFDLRMRGESKITLKHAGYFLKNIIK
ncbi:MAG TPA: glycosyltransferase [Candidatus Nanoarchaeia archaeon]|nr:glycosyltransferase [Candidatus Nanoarchaeia archaeon]